MKKATSVNPTCAPPKEVDGLSGDQSALIKTATIESQVQSDSSHSSERDAALIERNAKRLNREAADVLGYQGWFLKR